MNLTGALVIFFTAVLLFIYLFFPNQINDMRTDNPTFGHDTSEISYDSLSDNFNKQCALVYPFDKNEDKCQSCNGFEYRKITIEEGHTHVVDGIRLKAGEYCIIDHLPDCDVNKGILMVSGNQGRCLCRFPQYFDGPSCSTRVACPEHNLVDKDNRVLNTDQFHDYYALEAKCVCDTYDKNGYALKSLGFECVIDPCLYPGVYLPTDVGWIENKSGYRECVCGADGILTNRNGPHSKCSNCSQTLEEVGKNDLKRTLAFDCANRNSLVVDLFHHYPCFSLNTDSNCGESFFTFSKR